FRELLGRERASAGEAAARLLLVAATLRDQAEVVLRPRLVGIDRLRGAQRLRCLVETAQLVQREAALEQHVDGIGQPLRGELEALECGGRVAQPVERRTLEQRERPFELGFALAAGEAGAAAGVLESALEQLAV